MRYIVVLLLVSGCATQPKQECISHLIDSDNNKLLTSIPHSCDAKIKFTASKPGVKVKKIEGNFIYIEGIKI